MILYVLYQPNQHAFVTPAALLCLVCVTSQSRKLFAEETA